MATKEICKTLMATPLIQAGIHSGGSEPHKTEQGYYAEFAIPFKSLRYDLPTDEDTVEWGITLVRYARRDIEVSTFPAIPQSFTPYRMTYAAKLRGVKVPPPSANIRIEPYALYQYETK